MKKPLLDIDPQGFARIQGDKPKGRLLAELYQNAKDEDAKNITVRFEYKGRGLSYFSVEDDSPEGFNDLSHAYTLFAPSYKLDHPEKSGWMNLGEKMVIVGTKWCRISTTKGEVFFDMKDQTREEFPRRKRDAGTEVVGEIATSQAEYAEAVAFLNMMLPTDKVVTINGQPLKDRKLKAKFQCTLPTRILGADGLASSSSRKTTVSVWEKHEGEEAHIYELGIPVVAFAPQDNMPWHVDVGQKVPLNKDRDNVTPSFKSLLLAQVLNNAYDHVEDVTANWVIEAASQPQVTKEATEYVLDEAYGENRVAASVTDLEANNKAVGGTAIPSSPPEA